MHVGEAQFLFLGPEVKGDKDLLGFLSWNYLLTDFGHYSSKPYIMKPNYEGKNKGYHGECCLSWLPFCALNLLAVVKISF